MKIDFSNIEETLTEGFKGGEGKLKIRNFSDKDCKIMRMALAPGASIGHHRHEGSCEIIHILEGEGHFIYDGQNEPFHSGDTHYCPDGHAHSMHNDAPTPLLYLAIVVTLHQ